MAKDIQLYLAPMEGLTGYVYRNAYRKYFGAIDRYFTPFLSNKNFSHRELADVLPEHNRGMVVIPQILTNRSADFLAIAGQLGQMGYGTVNLNLGCPSPTVVTKHRGAGFLSVLDELERFLDEIFARCPLAVSIKTRIGVESEREWERLLSIYEKYPLEELIIHPRLQKDFYRNEPHLAAFAQAAEKSAHSLCYNGDIKTTEDFLARREQFPGVCRFMLGRGILANPFLAGEIKAGAGYGSTDGCMREQDDAKKEKLHAFHDELLHGYLTEMEDERNTLFKMKELWVYLGEAFTDPQKYLKRIKKAQRLADYRIAVDALFREQAIRGGGRKENFVGASVS